MAATDSELTVVALFFFYADEILNSRNRSRMALSFCHTCSCLTRKPIKYKLKAYG